MSYSLETAAGLPIFVKGNLLEKGENVISQDVDTRTFKQIQHVLLDSIEDDPHRELYFMYRDVRLKEDEEKIRKKGLRYDITIIPPGKLGREYVKTSGHYHPNVPGKDVTYPEVYEVLEGTAHYLLQKPKKDSHELERVVVIEAKAGDKVFIPPNYGHITINPTGSLLVMANWVADNFKSIYEPIKAKGGGAYFEIEVEGNPQWIANKNYKNTPKLEKISLNNNEEFLFNFDGPLYTAVHNYEPLPDILVKP